MEETEMCRLIGKRSQSASCHETKGGSEEEKQCFHASVLFQRLLPSFPRWGRDTQDWWRLTENIDFYQGYFKYLVAVPSGYPFA